MMNAHKTSPHEIDTNIIEILCNYVAKSNEERLICKNLVEDGRIKELTSRANFPAHLTASAIIVDQYAERVLLIKHKNLDMWLQPGGHVEQGESLPLAALREAAEECGLAYKSILNMALVPIDVDMHEVPVNLNRGEPSHWHIDMRFLIQIDENLLEAPLEEHEMSWVNFGEELLKATSGRLARVNDLLWTGGSPAPALAMMARTREFVLST